MTLILGMSKPEGIYLSVDYRLTDRETGEPLTCPETKFLSVHYPPSNVGPKALIAYTGVSTVRGGKPVIRWLRDVLRRGPADFNLSMKNLKKRLQLDAYGVYGLILTMLVIHGDARYFVGFSNIRVADNKSSLKFDHKVEKIPTLHSFGSGWASRWALIEGGRLLSEQLNVSPYDPYSHMGLLAKINQQVAAKDDSVSPECHVAFMSQDRNLPDRQEGFAKVGDGFDLYAPPLRLDINSAAHNNYLRSSLKR